MKTRGYTEYTEDMSDILSKYPPQNKDEKNTTYQNFPYPDMSLDLHGHTTAEAENKLSWILCHAQYNDYTCIKIITGIGKKILKPLVRQQLQSWKTQNKIINFIEVIDENNRKTGVFLYLV